MRNIFLAICVSCIALTASAQSDGLSDETTQFRERLEDYIERLQETDDGLYEYIPRRPLQLRSLRSPELPLRGEYLRRVPLQPRIYVPGYESDREMSLPSAFRTEAMTIQLFTSAQGTKCMKQATGMTVTRNDVLIERASYIGFGNYNWDIVVNPGTDSEVNLYVETSHNINTDAREYNCEVWAD